MIIRMLSKVRLICSKSIPLLAIFIYNLNYNIKEIMIGGGLLDKQVWLLLIVLIDMLWQLILLVYLVYVQQIEIFIIIVYLIMDFMNLLLMQMLYVVLIFVPLVLHLLLTVVFVQIIQGVLLQVVDVKQDFMTMVTLFVLIALNTVLLVIIHQFVQLVMIQIEILVIYALLNRDTMNNMGNLQYNNVISNVDLV